MSRLSTYVVWTIKGEKFTVIADDILSATDPGHFIKINPDDGEECVTHLEDSEGNFIEIGYGSEVISVVRGTLFSNPTGIRAVRNTSVQDMKYTVDGVAKHYKSTYGDYVKTIRILAQELDVKTKTMLSMIEPEEKEDGDRRKG